MVVEQRNHRLWMEPALIFALWAHPAITANSIIVKDVDRVICWSF